MSDDLEAREVRREPFADVLEAQHAEYKPVEGYAEAKAQVEAEYARHDRREQKIDKIRELVLGKERSQPDRLVRVGIVALAVYEAWKPF